MVTARIAEPTFMQDGSNLGSRYSIMGFPSSLKVITNLFCLRFFSSPSVHLTRFACSLWCAASLSASVRSSLTAKHYQFSFWLFDCFFERKMRIRMQFMKKLHGKFKSSSSNQYLCENRIKFKIFDFWITTNIFAKIVNLDSISIQTVNQLLHSHFRNPFRRVHQAKPSVEVRSGFSHHIRASNQTRDR